MTAITRVEVPSPSGSDASPADLRAALDQALGTEAKLRRTIERQARQLREKSDLLTEVNHRAKNNLQMAIALLSMQALSSDDTRVAAALGAASQRLGYLARVHELLYQRGGDAQEIELSGFLRDIGGALEEAFRREEVAVSYRLTPLALEGSRAISVGLIVGEAMLNSYKYAFSAGAPGRIDVSCTREGTMVRLAVTDDGAGFPAEERRGSLGMRLLRALGRSLGGETIVTSGGGTAVVVAFPLSAPAES
ncbi:MAG TPA: sensor histidine kinase [Allosphingosinicella sp.]|nr:sensor histidine kinase [Allosphingosinicella sp.]